MKISVQINTHLLLGVSLLKPVKRRIFTQFLYFHAVTCCSFPREKSFDNQVTLEWSPDYLYTIELSIYQHT